MKKVLKDGSLGISEADRFVAPAGMNIDLSCSGGDEDADRKPAARQIIILTNMTNIINNIWENITLFAVIMAATLPSGR